MIAPVRHVRVTPIAFRDPPLLNVAGVHQPYALRSILEVETADGRVGLGESYGDARTIADLSAAAALLPGLAPHDLNGLAARVAAALGGGHDPAAPFPADASDRRFAVAYGAFEVALLDLQGQAAGAPLCDVLGGAVRATVPYSAYLFYKFARHRDHGPAEGFDDPWGDATTHEGLVAQARRMVALHGFGSIKLKAGVYAPGFEVASLRALRAAFPHHPLRIDPNGGWSVETATALLPELEGLLEYLEDPVPTLAGMGEIARRTPTPLATNMVTVAFGHLPETLRLRAVKVILSDHHYWGGLRATQHLAHVARVFDLGVSMHSNSHLGVTLAAMTHVAAAIPNLAYACDTHYPWQDQEVIAGGKLVFEEGALRVPTGPGLGVTLDPAALAELAEQFKACGIRVRDDAGEMRKYDPTFAKGLPRF